MKKSIFLLAGVLLLATLLTGCATTVKVTIERPAELELNGAKTIGILPFQAKSTSGMGGAPSAVIAVMEFLGYHDWTNSQDYQDRLQLVDLLTRTLQEELVNSEYLDLVDSNTIQTAVSLGRKTPCDVYLTGALSKFDTDIEPVIRKMHYADGEQEVLYYYRYIKAELMYQVVDAQTNKVISFKTIPVEINSYETTDYDAIESAYSLGRRQFIEIAHTIMRQLQPYKVDKYLSLLSDPHKDPDMEYADEMVKAGDVEYAESLYEDLYVKRGYMEAGYNAALLLEAMGELEDARDLMQEVYDIFKDSRALKAVEDIKSEIESANKLQHQNEIRKS